MAAHISGTGQKKNNENFTSEGVMQGIKNVLRLPRIGPANGVKANDGFLSPGKATNRGAFYLVGARAPPQALFYKYCENVLSLTYMKLARIYLALAGIYLLTQIRENFLIYVHPVRAD